MSTIANNLTSSGTTYNGKKIVIDSNGILYCCFQALVNSRVQIFVYKSEDGGNTWIDMNFPQILGYTQSNSSIAIDSNNKVHITWMGYDSNNTGYSQIKYSNNVSGSWSNWVNIQTIPFYFQQYPTIAIDSNNKCHVTWMGMDSSNSNYSQIKYSSNISGSWSSWVNIQPISGYYENSPSIAIDNNNKIHIAWHGMDPSTSYSQIKYSNNISGNWSNWVNIQTISGYHQYYPNITIDSNNKVHVTWGGFDSNNPSYSQIKYSNNISGSWGNWVNIQTISGYTQQNPSMVIDSNNKIHITWEGYDSNNTSKYQIKYSNNISGIWSNWTNQTNGTTSYLYPCCIYKNNNLYCIYQGTSTMEFFNISFNKYLLEQNNLYYTPSQIYYDNNTHKFIPLTLTGGTVPNINDFNNYGFNNISQLTTQVTYNTDTFIPYDKFNLGTKIYQYDGSNIILYDYKKGYKLLIQDGDRIKITIDGINLIDLGTTYNEDIFNTYGMNNLNNINFTVLNKIINNEYKILIYKVK